MLRPRRVTLVGNVHFSMYPHIQRYDARTARTNNAQNGAVSFEHPFAEGAFRNVYKGKYIDGERKGQDLVAKRFKKGQVATYLFDMELLVRVCMGD